MYNVVIVQGNSDVFVEVNGDEVFVLKDSWVPADVSSELTSLLEAVGVNPTIIAENYFKGN